MSKKNRISKLLAISMFFNAGVNSKAYVDFPKYFSNSKRHPMSDKTLDENQNLDDKYILNKLIEIDTKLLGIVNRFLDYQKAIEEIMNQIRKYFNEIKKSKRFDEISKTKEFEEKMDEYDRREFFGEEVTKDLIYDFYSLLPEDEKKQFDENAERLRKKLLDVLKNEETKFKGCDGEQFLKVSSNFDSLFETIMFKDNREGGFIKSLNLKNKKDILMYFLKNQKDTIQLMRNGKSKRKEKYSRITRYYYEYDFNNPKTSIEDFRSFLKDIDLHKQNVRAKFSKYLNRDRNKYYNCFEGENREQLDIISERRKFINELNEEINGHIKDLKFCLENWDS